MKRRRLWFQIKEEGRLIRLGLRLRWDYIYKMGYGLAGRVMSIGLNRDKTGLMGIGYGKIRGWISMDKSHTNKRGTK